MTDDGSKNDKNSDEEQLSTEGFSSDGSEIELVSDESSTKKANAKTKSKEDPKPAEEDNKKYLYLLAEFENHKRQAIKERSELLKYGAERIVRDLLEVMDNFDRALAIELNPDSINSYREGIEMTAKELRTVLEQHGVREGDNKVGAPFDPLAHEALSSEETNDIEPGHISQIFKKAYMLHDKVMRPAQVVVAKAVSQPENSDSENSDG